MNFTQLKSKTSLFFNMSLINRDMNVIGGNRMAVFQYEVFAKVVEYKTFYQAAQALNVTPSAVSHSITQFENELGFPLFIRNRTGVTLTPDGETVYPIVQSILNTESRLRQVADSIQGVNSGSIRIGGFSSVCINWLPPIIRSFRKKYPNIEISIVQGTFREIDEMVQQGKIDIGFSALPVASNLMVAPLINDPIYCVAPLNFTPQDKKHVTTDDIGNRHFILQKIDYEGGTKKALDRYNVTPNSISYSIDDQSILAMVASNLGLGILPELALQRITDDVQVFPFSESFHRTVCLVTNKVQAEAPSTQRMIQEIDQYLAKAYGDQYLASLPSK